jgi:YD repeat-containing protein
MNYFKNLLLAVAALWSGTYVASTQAQTAPSPTECVQRGGRMLCVLPLVGEWGYKYQRCDSPNNAPNEEAAITLGAAKYHSGCGGDQMIDNVGPWGTEQAQTAGSCGSGGLYPMFNTGVEYANAKVISVRYCFANPGGPATDAFTVYRIRPVICPDGYYALSYSNTEGYCTPRLSTKCTTCNDTTSDNLVGNPIDISNGNKKQVETDYAPSGSMLYFTRTYGSLQDSASSRLGRKWTHNFDRRLFMVSNNANVVFSYRGNGTVYTHWKTNGVWTRDPDVNDRIAPILDTGNAIIGWRLTLADDSVEDYSTSGLLLSHTMRGGLSVTLTYSDANTSPTVAPVPGLLIGATDSFGKTLSWTYDAKSRIAGMQDAAGQQYLYAYDTDNNLSSVSYPDATSRTYVYNEQTLTNSLARPYHLTGIQDENNVRFASYGYDNAGNARLTEHAGGVNRYTATINTGNYTATVTDPLGTIRSYSFSAVHGIYKFLQMFEPCAGCTPASSNRVKHYDANGNLYNTYDFNGQLLRTNYDLSRNLETSRVEAFGTASARTTSTTWHPTYRIPLTITEPTSAGNRVTTFTHDSAGNVLTKTVTVGGTSRLWTYSNYDAYGRVGTVNGPRSDVTDTTSYAYYANTSGQGNNRGMLYTVTNAAGHVTTITSYNAHGQPLSITDPNGLVTNLTYDARLRLTARQVGNEVTLYDYDNAGQLIKVTMPDGSYLEYTYDNAHRLTGIQDGQNNKIFYTLDNAGNRTLEQYVDPANLLTRMRTRVYDALSRLKQDIGGTAPGSQVTGFGYDRNGNVIDTTDPASRVTTQSYDALNRLLQVVDPFNGGSAPTKYEYDAQDNLTKVTDPKNLATTYVYNGFNELTSQVSPDTGTTGFTYDAAGNLSSRTDARNVTATYTYDNLNRVATIAFPAFGSDAAETVTYTYDSCTNGKGRLCSLSDKTGTTSYSYDIKGRVTGKSQVVGALTQSVTYGYNPAGQMTSIVTPSGKTITYTYQNNRPVSVAIGGKTVLSQAVYEPFGPIGGWLWGNSTSQAVNAHQRFHDLDYRATQVMSDYAGAGSLVRNLSWNGNDTISAIADPASSANSFTYGYDALDRLTSVAGGGSFGYSYDGVGNRLTQITSSGTTSYSYPGSSHKLQSLTGAQSKAYQYDAAGNRTVDGANTWTYGANNRPISVAATGGTSQFLINALGQRVKKTTPTATTRFFYDEAGRLLGEYDDSGTRLKEHVWLNDLPVAVIK